MLLLWLSRCNEVSQLYGLMSLFFYLFLIWTQTYAPERSLVHKLHVFSSQSLGGLFVTFQLLLLRITSKLSLINCWTLQMKYRSPFGEQKMNIWSLTPTLSWVLICTCLQRAGRHFSSAKQSSMRLDTGTTSSATLHQPVWVTQGISLLPFSPLPWDGEMLVLLWQSLTPPFPTAPQLFWCSAWTLVQALASSAPRAVLLHDGEECEHFGQELDAFPALGVSIKTAPVGCRWPCHHCVERYLCFLNGQLATREWEQPKQRSSQSHRGL